MFAPVDIACRPSKGGEPFANIGSHFLWPLSGTQLHARLALQSSIPLDQIHHKRGQFCGAKFLEVGLIEGFFGHRQADLL
ncbi:hypothetical protein A3764_14175 [Sulfitobacter sp. HI0129]|nr:hypothetical protein A3764_14175 [Sulfitobacter sp. HI0129]